MEFQWVLFAGLFLLIVCVIAVLLKRTLNVSYDRKALMAPSIGFVVTTIFYIAGNLDNGYQATLAGEDWWDKLGWTVVVLFLINAGLQFVFWLLWTFVRKYRIVRLPRFVFNMAIFIMFVGAVLYLIKNNFNQELSGLLITSTVLSAVIGLALQDTLGNLFSGISLQLEAPFNVEDWVNLGGFEGKVVSQNWRTLTILTRDAHRVSLTNKFVAEDKIVNYSRPTRRQIHTFSIVLDYRHPPNFVKKVLIDMLDEVEEVVPHSTLGAYISGYEDSGIKYSMKYWMTDYAHVNEIQDVVLSRLWYALKRHEIKIPYPISEVQMSLIASGDEESRSKEELIQIKKLLRGVDWLDRISDENIEFMSENIAVHTYGQNDVIIKQGEGGDSMFIIMDGMAKVFISTETDKMVEVAEKKPGEFIGEMSLLTGEPRSASVKAAVDMRVLMMNKNAFSNVLMKDEHILNEMIEGMQEYKTGLARIIAEERERSDATEESAKEIVLQKIRAYLAL